MKEKVWWENRIVCPLCGRVFTDTPEKLNYLIVKETPEIFDPYEPTYWYEPIVIICDDCGRTLEEWEEKHGQTLDNGLMEPDLSKWPSLREFEGLWKRLREQK